MPEDREIEKCGHCGSFVYRGANEDGTCRHYAPEPIKGSTSDKQHFVSWPIVNKYQPACADFVTVCNCKCHDKQ